MDMAISAGSSLVNQTKPALGAQPAASRAGAASRKGRYNQGDDPELIQACLEGDELAWETLVHRYAGLVYSIPRRLGLSAADADDVMQNVFTIAFRRLSGLKNHQCLAAWLITVARRECLHHAKRMPEHESLAEEIMDGGSHLSTEVELQQRRMLVHQALGLLEPNSQALLSALFLEMPTPSYECIAQRLGMAVGSIGPARARSLKKLESALRAIDADSFCTDGND